MTDEYQIRQIPRTKTELDGTEWFEGQDDNGGEDASFKVQASAFASIGLVRVDHTSDYPMVAGDLGNNLHTNIGASGPVTLTLPPALVGTGALFFCTGQYPLILDPNGTDTISDGGAGKRLYITGRGLVVLDCIEVAGNFEPTTAEALALVET